MHCIPFNYAVFFIVSTNSSFFLLFCWILIGLNLFILCAQVSHSIIISCYNKKNCSTKKHKSIKSLSLFYHGTVKYIDQIIINLNTHCLLIDFSKRFLLIIRNYILSKLSIWMLSFRYRNNEKIIQYTCSPIERNVEKKLKGKKIRIGTSTHRLMMEKQMNK